jgi:tetratricopeptide (TPR) repeat protein
VNWLIAILLSLAVIGLQVFIGGAKLLYAEPAYGVVALASILALLPLLRVKHLPQPLCVLSTLLLGAYVALRANASPVEYLARPDLHMVLACLATYLAAAYAVTDVRLRLFVIGAVLVFSAAHVLTGLVQFKENNEYMLLPWIFRTPYGARGSGFYICPNHLAGMLELLGLFGLGLVCWSRWRTIPKILAGYLAAVCYVGVAVSGSRGGYISTSISLVGFIVFTIIAAVKAYPERAWKIVPFAVFAGVVLTAGALVLMSKSDLLSLRVRMISEWTNMRWLLWAAAMKQFDLSPIFGTGAGTYLYYGRMFRSALVQNDPVYVHNDYVHLLAEYGLVGASLFLVFLVTHIVVGIKNFSAILVKHAREDPTPGNNILALHIAMLACIVAYMVHSIMDFNMHIPSNAIFMSMILGMLANPGIKLRKASRTGEVVSKTLGFAMPATGVLLAFLALPKWAGEYYSEMARVSLRDSMWPETIQYAEGGLAVERRNPNLYYYLAETQRIWGFTSKNPEERSRLTEDAIRNFKAGLEAFPDDINLLLKLGLALDQMQRFDEAEPYFQKAMKDDPNFGNVYAYYGLHLQARGQFDEAEAMYRKCLKVDWQNLVAKVGLNDIKKIREAEAKRPKMRPEVLELFEGPR